MASAGISGLERREGSPFSLSGWTRSDLCSFEASLSSAGLSSAGLSSDGLSSDGLSASDECFLLTGAEMSACVVGC